jgi:hypothetical protein
MAVFRARCRSFFLLGILPHCGKITSAMPESAPQLETLVGTLDHPEGSQDDFAGKGEISADLLILGPLISS